MKKYEIVREHILAGIRSNLYMPGMVIQSENELSDELGVSRVTVRKALEDLCAENTLYKIKGKGTFVSERPKYFEFLCGLSFSSEMRKHNRVPSTKFVKLDLVLPDAQTNSELQINSESKVWEVVRVRCADGVPIAFVHEYFPYLLATDLNEKIAQGSIYAFLEEKGIAFGYADQKISAVLADERISGMLEIPKGSPMVKMVITAYTRTGTPFNHGITWYHTENFTLLQSIYRQRTVI